VCVFDFVALFLIFFSPHDLHGSVPIDYMYGLLKCLLKDEMLYFALDVMGAKIKLCMKYLAPENNGPGWYF
jgi:hypothetical protein